jgi:hypothetical protein
MTKILGKGNYRIELHFYAHGEWHKRIFAHKTLKGAYIKARIIQHNYNGALYWFTLVDCEQGKIRWLYNGETNACKWCNRLMLRQGDFNAISGYTSIMQGA